MIKIGTCGYGYYNPPDGWKDKYKSKLQAYSDDFKVCELNKTFYKLPMVKTARKWRRNAFDDFEFVMKAWQALTHPTSSPTWRNKKDKLSKEQKEKFGYLQPNNKVIEAWNDTKAVAEAMDAEVVVIQTPGSFECSKENEYNMYEFFGKIDRGNLEIGWEPRGDWKRNENRVKEICDDLNLIHIVDIMRRDPVSDYSIAYTRIHGLNEDEYNYNYDYSEKEMEELGRKLKELDKSNDKVYCMFNNYEMFENAEYLIDSL